MVRLRRWFTAQKHERNFWEETARRISLGAIGQLDWYEWKAGELEKLLLKLNLQILANNPNILEIGSGPIGIVNHLHFGKRCAIDPLEDYYRSNSTLTELRNSKVCYLRGSGETLPFRSDKLAIVIIDNAIDHTHDPGVVLREIYRTLQKKGIMYLTVNVHTPYGAGLHKILSGMKIDTKHPHTYTFESISTVLKENRFKILYEAVEDYKQIRKRNIESGNFKSRIKGYAGLSEMLYQTVCIKE